MPDRSAHCAPKRHIPATLLLPAFPSRKRVGATAQRYVFRVDLVFLIFAFIPLYPWIGCSTAKLFLFVCLFFTAFIAVLQKRASIFLCFGISFGSTYFGNTWRTLVFNIWGLQMNWDKETQFYTVVRCYFSEKKNQPQIIQTLGGPKGMDTPR